MPVVCRTPGFWGTHAADGTDNPRKPKANNITQYFLDQAGGLTICGTYLDNTDAGNQHSALEALCVAPRGEQRLQLGRQLTAAYLNCQIELCPASVLDLLDSCNEACVLDSPDVGPCIEAVDAFNNGVSDLAPGCHDLSIPQFQPPGPAGSGNLCGSVNTNGCDIFSCP